MPTEDTQDSLDSTASRPLSDQSSVDPPPEPQKRRPLPTPPSSSMPSSPPPPYSICLPDDTCIPMTREISGATQDVLLPEAPVIMPPQPAEQGEHSRAPFDSFLCHTPLPNTWIGVETTRLEYVLIIRLPGFRRDGITIATRRRRILHLVADSWEPEGGHFERRVSFGHDAELAQVRAEFDGEMLRIMVPRRMSALSS